MNVKIFDDKWSIGHILIAFLTLINMKFFVIFIGYEVIEFCYKRNRGETVEHFIGDIFEYLGGLGLMWLLLC